MFISLGFLSHSILSIIDDERSSPFDIFFFKFPLVDLVATLLSLLLMNPFELFLSQSLKKTNPASELIDLQKTKVSKTILELRQTKAVNQIEKNASKLFQIAGQIAKSAAVNMGSAVKGQINKQRTASTAATGSSPQGEKIQITSEAKVMSV
jgi:hypothetical protein